MKFTKKAQRAKVGLNRIGTKRQIWTRLILQRVGLTQSI